ncbi:MAG: hypothetical protein QY871_02395 [Dehalococcoides mccartyi]|nr:hypothetical protein [Dehalococcoides mccartyi]
MKARARCQTTPLKAQGGYADVLLPPQHHSPYITARSGCDALKGFY